MKVKHTKKRHKKSVILFIIALATAVFFMLPTVLTIATSFLRRQEIKANYVMVFNDQESAGYISEKVNLKFIPDMVTFKQFATVLLNSPDYLLKFWNTVIYTIP
ncbi:MAG: hypothetical protein K1W06_09300, partial [Lachnospiraceae bacterium]